MGDGEVMEELDVLILVGCAADHSSAIFLFVLPEFKETVDASEQVEEGEQQESNGNALGDSLHLGDLLHEESALSLNARPVLQVSETIDAQLLKYFGAASFGLC